MRKIPTMAHVEERNEEYNNQQASLTQRRKYNSTYDVKALLVGTKDIQESFTNNKGNPAAVGGASQ